MRVLRISLIFSASLSGSVSPTICPSSAMPKISAPPSVFAKALTLLHQLLGFFTSSAAFLSYSVVSPIRFSISICSDHFLREISVLLLYNFAGAVCNRKLYSPVLSCTHGRKTIAGRIQFFVVLRIGYNSILVFYLFSIYLCWICRYREIPSR